MQKIKPFQQAVLFQYICEKGLPKWAEGSEVKVFAKLMNITQEQADAAYQRAYNAGYLDKIIS
jgi:hypothetical protein